MYVLAGSSKEEKTSWHERTSEVSPLKGRRHDVCMYVSRDTRGFMMCLYSRLILTDEIATVDLHVG